MVRQASDTAGLTSTGARIERRPLRSAHGVTGRDAADRILGVPPSYLLALFMAALLVPAQFQVGPINLSVYMVMIIVFALPLFQRFFADATSRIIALDVIVAFYVVWIGLSIVYNHGLSRAVFVVNQAITLYGGYMMGRILVRSEADYRLLFRTILILLAALAPFAIIEMLTRQMLINDILGMVMTVNPRATNEMRMGLNRVQTVFEHPILYGLFCSIAVANFYYLYRRSLVWAPAVGLASVMTFASLSSAPNISMMIQYCLIAWERLTRLLPARWFFVCVALLLVLGTVQVVVEGGLLGFVINTLAFNPQTGWGRTEIFEYGSAEVLRRPVFGLGFDDWTRPWWRKESVDNFWLLTAMRYGLPTLVLLWLAIGGHLARIMAQKDLSEGESDCRLGYVFAWIGLFFVLGTVHIWGPLSVFVMVYLGAGAWIYARPVPPFVPRRAQNAPPPVTEAAPPPPAPAMRRPQHDNLAEARRRRQALRPDERP